MMKALAGMGDAGLIVLALAFVFGALAFVPRNLMCVLGGTVFGHAAFPVALASATLGACAALLIARYLFRRPFQRMTDRRPAWRAVAAAVDDEGWRIALLLRIASPLPGTAVNYVFGLTRIPLWQFAAATALGLLPQTFFFVHLGSKGSEVLAAPAGSAQTLTLAAAGLLCTGAVMILVVRRARAALSAGSQQRLLSRASAGPPRSEGLSV